MKNIIHVSEIDISQNGGMARVEYYLKKSFEQLGYNFIHIGPKEVGEIKHKGLFPYLAYMHFKKLNVKPYLFIVHEPAAGQFINKGVPCFVESHGIERRIWNINKKNESFKTKMLFPIWRLYNCDRGIKNSKKILVLNSTDKKYVIDFYKRNENDIFIYKNGVFSIDESIETSKNDDFFTILFNGSWIERKGIYTLIKAADKIYNAGIFDVQYLLIGTGKTEEEVINYWPYHLKSFLKIIPKFESNQEIDLLKQSNIFILPSISEGQPLSLLQAMAVGKCCITTNADGQKDIITNGQNGYLFNVGNYDELSELIIKCYSNRNLCNKIGEKAKESVTNRTWEKTSLELVKYIIDNI
ncbi:glycosyltransferase family 4 protein [Cloacibacterium sp.]|uniref:glycosyltransferase family 4 protein n=1 Tax=Cloacibacterium sp. TaxID=1913682 RepID=UPI0039E4FEF0